MTKETIFRINFINQGEVYEVEKAGRGRITSGEGKLATFPMAIMPPGGKKGNS